MNTLTARRSGSGGVRAVLVDGAAIDQLPIGDRGLAYGDGLFETIRIVDASPCLWDEHMRRLLASCRRLGIRPPARDRIEREARSLAVGCADGVLKIVITRGCAGRGYRPDPESPARRICMRFDPPSYPPEWHRDGVRVRVCGTQASHNPALAGLKHLNRLDNVLARSEWTDPQVAEGLMLGPDGAVVSGTMSNLFLWDGQALVTPPLDRCGVAGTMRATLFRLAAEQGVGCFERSIRLEDLATARGVFLTNALIGAWPVCRIESRAFDPRRLPLGILAELQRVART